MTPHDLGPAAKLWLRNLNIGNDVRVAALFLTRVHGSCSVAVRGPFTTVESVVKPYGSGDGKAADESYLQMA